MTSMHPDVKMNVLGFLGRALSLELSAVQQYLTLSRLLRARGFDEEGAKFHGEAMEEMAHAELIIGRMLALGAVPNSSQLRPAYAANSLTSVIEHAHKFEDEIVLFYESAVAYCRQANDHDNYLFFEKLLNEERAHAGSFVQWRSKFASLESK